VIRINNPQLSSSPLKAGEQRIRLCEDKVRWRGELERTTEEEEGEGGFTSYIFYTGT
jgi:hypothetical protein